MFVFKAPGNRTTLDVMRERAVTAEAELKDTKNDLHQLTRELLETQDMVHDLQERLLDYEETKQALDEAQANLHKTSVQLLEARRDVANTASQAKLIKESWLQSTVASSECTLMWARELKEEKAKLAAVQMAAKEKHQCSACQICAISVAAIPCGHCYCSNCGKNISRCAVCRGVIDRVQRLYM